MDGLELFAILMISIVLIMMFQGTLGISAHKEIKHKKHRHHHHPYHPHKHHPHRHRHHHERLYEGYTNSDEYLYKNSSDVEQRNYGVYDDKELHNEHASEIFAEA